MRPGLPRLHCKPHIWGNSHKKRQSSIFSLPGNRLRVYAFLEEPARVSAALAERGVSLAAMQTNATDLESYFLNLIERAERSDI